MTVTNYWQWIADGKPYRNAVPIGHMETVFTGYGYVVGTIGNYAHLTANPPEDHCPYSHTPWPGPQPYPNGMAIDIMPTGPIDLAIIGEKIFQDKQNNSPGTRWLKYMNWTDSNGDCWHDSWEPNHVRVRSNDTEHIHCSCRTDYVNSAINYDPIGELLMDVSLNQDSLNAIRRIVNAPFTDNLKDPNLNDSTVGHMVGVQQWPDHTQDSTPQVAYYVAFGNAVEVLVGVSKKLDQVITLLQSKA